MLYFSVKNMTARQIEVESYAADIRSTYDGEILEASRYSDVVLDGGETQSFVLEKFTDEDGYNLGTDSWEVESIYVNPNGIDVDVSEYDDTMCY
ncbi:hypothetical protein C441_10351 [Haloferax sulfurifontis ATCC BAA-897]|uniref:Uncharacterized protein n=1 Tax=Haloferax sulfurifontis ATCC BAA-897 TaxID=662480 RepID=M0IB52_9EURY|nr:hypothetical protein C441_10351 [Haloferax sulfurifontis ATCC BAA-897]